MDMQQIRAQMSREQTEAAEREISNAIAFAEAHLNNRSNTFIGALLGLLVGMSFGGGDVSKFDQWTQLIRADMSRKAQQGRH